MRIVSFLLISLLAVGASVSAESLSVDELQKVNAQLQSEFELARSEKPYLLIDLQEHQLQLKVCGLALQTWQIVRFRLWGHPAAVPAVKLESKSSPDEPDRETQVVNTAELVEDAAAKPLKALELADMPTVYRMRLENGTVISVRPASIGRFGRLRDVYAIPAWYLSRPLISNWNFLHGSLYNELALSMSEQGARKLYWALSEGTPCLIRLPAAVAMVP